MLVVGAEEMRRWWDGRVLGCLVCVRQGLQGADCGVGDDGAGVYGEGLLFEQGGRLVLERTINEELEGRRRGGEFVCICEYVSTFRAADAAKFTPHII